MKSTMTIRIPAKLRRELEAISRSEKIPVSEFVRDSLKQSVSLHRFRRLRGKVLPFAEAQGFLTDEDVFRAVS